MKQNLSYCPRCNESSVAIKKRKDKRILICINKGCGWMRFIEEAKK